MTQQRFFPAVLFSEEYVAGRELLREVARLATRFYGERRQLVSAVLCVESGDDFVEIQIGHRTTNKQHVLLYCNTASRRLLASYCSTRLRHAPQSIQSFSQFSLTMRPDTGQVRKPRSDGHAEVAGVARPAPQPLEHRGVRRWFDLARER